VAVTPADAPLLATKLFVPSPRQNRVSRSRLRDLLDAVRGGTVTLTAAPAGSGKSTLLADWAQTTQRRVAWLSLDAEDDEPRRFINYVIAALKNAGIVSSSDALPPIASSKPEAIGALLNEVLNAIAHRQAPAVLVLDDYHVIEGESVHRIVQRIIDHIPSNFHLILASRVDPPLALSRMRARDMLLEIRAADLRFTDDEAARFFNEAMGLSLTSEEIAELDKRTEGWAVGLQMAAISLRGAGGAKTFISSFSGSNRYVLDYLTEEVLQRQSQEVRSFLLETSILERLSAPLCGALTGRSDSERILEELDSANLFLIPLDDVRYWYRYHHLFGSLLLHELERSRSAEQIAELHRRASLWYTSNRVPEAALHHAVAAGDEDRSIAIVKEHARTHINAGDGGTIIRWISLLPRHRVEADFDLLMTHGTALTAEYRLEEAMQELTRAEGVMPATDGAKGAVLSMRGMLERMSGQNEQATETLERAMTLLDPSDFWSSMASFHLGIGALTKCDLPRAARYFDETTASRDQPDGMLTAVIGRAYGGWCALSLGNPDRAVQMASEANGWVDAWSAKHGTRSPLNALAYSLLADTYRLWNDLDRARAFAEKAVESGRLGFFIGYVEGSRVLAQIADAQGDWDPALAAAREMGCAIRCAGALEGMGPVNVLEYRVLWRRGLLTGNHADLDAVARWCEESGFLAAERLHEPLHIGLLSDYSVTIGARVLIHQKRYEEAERLLDDLADDAFRRQRVPGQIAILILRSLLDATLGRGDAAVTKMQKALEIAARPRFIRPFLDEGSAAVPIVERAAAGMANRDFAMLVLSAFDVPLKVTPAVEGLSEREIEVLQLIAAGSSNVEAARKLFVAPSTVKKHLENIYAKLRVGGRTQAVARARELRILA
jgi:LuxR family transcriptional regulator, maltose regulon positive regulatory protein